MTSSAFAELQRSYSVQRGDVVVAIVGATTGKSAVVGAMENVTVQRSLAILRPNPIDVRSDYLNLLMSSEVIQGQLHQIIAKYAAQPGIYLNELGGLQVIYPSLHDQDLIIAYVKSVSKPLNVTIERLIHEIDLLREYRTRLVADVVTGKLDVSEAAARLLEEELLLDLAAADDEPDDLPIEEEDDV
jgi:type I restriction enzyme, S subunit